MVFFPNILSHVTNLLLTMLARDRILGEYRPLVFFVQPQAFILQVRPFNGEQFFHVVLFIIMLYKVVLTFKSVDETLVCDHSNESY